MDNSSYERMDTIIMSVIKYKYIFEIIKSKYEKKKNILMFLNVFLNTLNSIAL